MIRQPLYGSDERGRKMPAGVIAVSGKFAPSFGAEEP
jgi:hypothetical protein